MSHSETGKDMALTSRKRTAQTTPMTLNRAVEKAALRVEPLPLVSQAASVPDSGGWTPKKPPAHPGMPMPIEKRSESGSILLPDVMRLRREEAMERRRTGGSVPKSEEPSALPWKRDIQEAVRKTLAENKNKNAASSKNLSHQQEDISPDFFRVQPERVLSEEQIRPSERRPQSQAALRPAEQNASSGQSQQVDAASVSGPALEQRPRFHITEEVAPRKEPDLIPEPNAADSVTAREAVIVPPAQPEKADAVRRVAVQEENASDATTYAYPAEPSGTKIPPALLHRPDADNGAETLPGETAQISRKKPETAEAVRHIASQEESASRERAQASQTTAEAYPAQRSNAEASPTPIHTSDADNTSETPQASQTTAEAYPLERSNAEMSPTLIHKSDADNTSETPSGITPQASQTTAEAYPVERSNAETSPTLIHMSDADNTSETAQPEISEAVRRVASQGKSASGETPQASQTTAEAYPVERSNAEMSPTLIHMSDADNTSETPSGETTQPEISEAVRRVAAQGASASGETSQTSQTTAEAYPVERSNAEASPTLIHKSDADNTSETPSGETSQTSQTTAEAYPLERSNADAFPTLVHMSDADNASEAPSGITSQTKTAEAVRRVTSQGVSASGKTPQASQTTAEAYPVERSNAEASPTLIHMSDADSTSETPSGKTAQPEISEAVRRVASQSASGETPQASPERASQTTAEAYPAQRSNAEASPTLIHKSDADNTSETAQASQTTAEAYPVERSNAEASPTLIHKSDADNTSETSSGKTAQTTAEAYPAQRSNAEASPTLVHMSDADNASETPSGKTAQASPERASQTTAEASPTLIHMSDADNTTEAPSGITPQTETAEAVRRVASQGANASGETAQASQTTAEAYPAQRSNAEASPTLIHKSDADNTSETPSGKTAQASQPTAETAEAVRRVAAQGASVSGETARAYPAEPSGAEIAPESLSHLPLEDRTATPQGYVAKTASPVNVGERQKRNQSDGKPVSKISGKPSPETPKSRAREADVPVNRIQRVAKERTARDIRTAIPRNAAPRPWTPEPLVTPAFTDAAAPLPGTETPERDAYDWNGVAPLSLTFPHPGGEASVSPAPEAATSGNEVPALPEWAQKLLDKPDAKPPGASATPSVSRAPEARRIQWTAPNAVTPTLPRPASITWLEREAPQQPPQPPAMSDAEIRRTADKIYRIIEERLQRELRRSGK